MCSRLPLVWRTVASTASENVRRIERTTVLVRAVAWLINAPRLAWRWLSMSTARHAAKTEWPRMGAHVYPT
jgi:hypothetical protein